MGEIKFGRILISLLIAFLFGVTSVQAEVVVIANKSVPTDALNQKEVKKIFLGKKMYWEGNQKIALVILTKDTAHKEFVQKFLGKSTSQFTNYWKQQLFTGKGMLPKRVKADEMIETIKITNGAIGYLPAELAAGREDIKVININ